MKIEYDSRKAALNLQKHGVSFEEAETVFYDPLLLTKEDKAIVHEQRFLSTGISDKGNVLVVVWTLRDDSIRIISAWRADKQKREYYEKQY